MITNRRRVSCHFGISARLNRLVLICGCLLANSGLPSLSAAATLDWDTVGPGGGSITGGAGNWNTALTNWTADGGTTNVAWVNANLDTARFGGTGGIVSLTQAAPGVTVGGLVFNSDGYQLSASATNPLVLGTGATIVVTTAGHTATINGGLGGTVGINLSGAGRLVLAGTNTFTGSIAVNGATLSIAGPGGTTDPLSLGAAGARSITLTNGGTFQVTGTSQLNNNNNTKTVVIGSGGGTIDITDATGLLIFDDANQFSGTGIFTKKGLGTVRMLYGSDYAYTGSNINVDAGTLQVLNGGNLGTSNPTITIAGGATFDIQATLSGTKPIAVAGTGVGSNGALVASAGTGVLNGGVTLTGNASIGGAGSLTLSGSITDTTNSFTLTKVGAGNTTLSGAANAWDGGTFINGGTLNFVQAGSLPGTGLITLAAGTGVGFGFNVDQTTLNTRIAAVGTGAILLGGAQSSDIDFSATGANYTSSIRLGGMSGATGTMTGTFTPTGSAYMLGGPGTLNFINNNALTGARNVDVGVAGSLAAGIVRLSGSNDYTGTTTVSGQSTLRLAHTNAIAGSSGLTLGGILDLRQNSSVTFATPPIAISSSENGTINVDQDSSGTNNVLSINTTLTIPSGRTLTVTGANGYSLRNLQGITLTAAGTIAGTTAFEIQGAMNYNSTLTTSNTLLLPKAAAVGTGSTAITGGTLALSNPNQIAGGNLNINGGTLLFDNMAYATFTAARSNGAGANQWQFTSGGLAARGTNLVVSGGGSNEFNGNLSFGSTAQLNGALYANANVEIAQDIAITAERTITVANTGPGLNGTNIGPSYRISGNISGSGALVVTAMSNPLNDNEIAELILSGTNTWVGAPTIDTDGGGTNTQSSAGKGGLIINTGHNNPAINGDVFVRFVGQGSLPNGNNGGATAAYLFANRYNQPGNGRSGFLFTGDADGESYQLNTNYKIVLNGSQSSSATGAAIGSSGGHATLQNSDVALLNGSSGSGLIAMTSVVLVRDGTFTLGSNAGAVKFQPATIANNGGTDPGINSAASALSNGTLTRTLLKRGEGTLILNNVGYTLVDGTGDTFSQMVWDLGRGVANNSGATTYFDGAVRGLADNDAVATNANSLRNFTLRLRGGVYESDGSGLGVGLNSTLIRTLGTSSGNINWGAGGGGFSAINRQLDVTISGTLEWAATNAMQNGDALIFGSNTANDVVNFQTNIGLHNADSVTVTREIRVLDNANSTGDYAIISGNILNRAAGTPGGSGTRSLLKTGTGKLVLTGFGNDYNGTTTVSAGTLQVDGVLTTSASAVSVNSGATLSGIGTINRPVNILAGGNLNPGASPGILDTAALTLSSGSNLNIELGGTTAGDGTGFHDQVNVTGTVTLTGSNLNVTTLGGFSASPGTLLFIVKNDDFDGITGEFSTLTNGGTLTAGAYTFQISYFGDADTFTFTGGNDVVLQVQSVPEPGTLALLGLGVVGLVIARRKKNRR